jgi:hypothetical protein
MNRNHLHISEVSPESGPFIADTLYCRFILDALYLLGLMARGQKRQDHPFLSP